ncbi:MAG: hypothetical protein MPL62_01610 [Alphaproteobacteria bacterium]|nr:hypothetical protein [Alphaproteobacteria bacterium]
MGKSDILASQVCGDGDGDGDRNGDGDGNGESPIKDKALIGIVMVVRPLIKEKDKFIFLRAAPAGDSWCLQQERLSRRVQSPPSLVETPAPTGLPVVRHMAL